MKVIKKQTFLLLSIVLLATSCIQINTNVTTKKNTEPEPTKPEQTEVYTPIPKQVTLVKGIPSDAIVLFNGQNLNAWESSETGIAANWIINPDGSMTVKDKSGNIQTKQNFGDVQLHLEWKSPKEVRGDGQHRANSGVFLQSRYEVQILDNNNNPTYVNGQVGAIYKQFVPLVMASVPSGEWNSYDIIFNAPKFDERGNKIKSGSITLLQNNILVQNNVQLKGTTQYIGYPKDEPHGDAPIMLQDHMDNSGVSYRNIWVRPL